MKYLKKTFSRPDSVWLGCQLMSNHKPQAAVLATMRYGALTLQLRQIGAAYCTHAFLLAKGSAADFAEQLELGHSADGALNRALDGKLQVIVTTARGKLFNMAMQLPPSKIVDGDRIHKAQTTGSKQKRQKSV